MILDFELLNLGKQAKQISMDGRKFKGIRTEIFGKKICYC